MAKKKIEEDVKAPVLRGPVPPEPEPPANTNCNSYIIHDPDHELAMKVTDGSVDGVWLDGVDISGGGDAYIAAHVAIDCSAVPTKMSGVVVANYQQENEYFKAAAEEDLNTMYVNNIIVPLAANAEEPGTELYLTIPANTSTSVTGDITDNGYGNLYVTGDGTITIIQI